METIESVQRAVRAWRRDHRRGPLPVSLRGRIGALATELGDREVSGALGVRPAVIRQWRLKLSTARPRRRSRSSRPFVELRPELMAEVAERPTRAELRIEVAGPGGALIRIEGPLDTAQVAAIVRSAVRPGVEA